ncbi:hypothetical protein BDC45DRAFT_559084 [Circinella umbellata]|nr:hypothetical protein BDC45DRAFT_559084 [Circinella umbellata]
MSEHSPPPNSPHLPVWQGPSADSPTRYADAARKTPPKTLNHLNNLELAMHLSSSTPIINMTTFSPLILLYLLLLDHKILKLLSSTKIEDLLVKDVGPVIALNTRVSKQQHIPAEVLFTKPEHRQQAITDGIIVKGERIIALPHIAADTNLIKVNMYQLPVCDPRELTDELFSILANTAQTIKNPQLFLLWDSCSQTWTLNKRGMHYLHVEDMRSMQPDEKLGREELRLVNLENVRDY